MLLHMSRIPEICQGSEERVPGSVRGSNAAWLTGAAGQYAGLAAPRGHPLKCARRLGRGVDVAEAVAAGDGFLHRALLYRGAAELGGKGL